MESEEQATGSDTIDYNSSQVTRSEAPAPNKSRRRVSIRFWLASLVLACVVPVWIAAGFLVYHNYQSKRALTEEHTLETARALTLVMDRELANMQSSLVDLATSSSVVTGDLAAFYPEAQMVLTVVQPGADIVLSDATGQELMNTSHPFGASLPKRGSLEAVRQVFDTGRPVIANVYKGGSTGQLKVSADVPVIRYGRVVYDLAMAVPPDRFSTVLLQQHLPPEWVGTVFDAHHMIVARTRAAEQLVDRTVVPALRQRMQSASEGTAEVVDPEGIPIIDCFSRSATSGWTVVISVPKATMMAEIWRWLALATTGTALLSFIGIALALYMARRIATSIQGLIAPALALGRGEPVAIGSFELAETSEVGESLLKASELIQQRAEERERARAVRQEADDLKRFNKELELSETAARARATELSVIMDTVPAAVFIGHDPECQWMTSNRAACELLKLQSSANPSAPGGEKAWNYRVLRDGKELSTAEMPVQLAAATGIEIRDCECTVVFDDGGSRIIFGNAVPLFDENGKSRGAVGAFIDITERKRTEEALRNSERMYRALGDSLDYGVWICTPDGRNTYTSESFLRFMGMTQEECSGFGWYKAIHPDELESAIATWTECLANGEKLRAECRIRGVDAQWHPALVRGAPVRDDRGEIISWVGVNIDISESKQAEEVVRSSQAQLQGIINSAMDAVISIDEQQRIVVFNRAAESVFQCPASEALGSTIDRFVSENFRKLHSEHIRRFGIDGAPQGSIISEGYTAIRSNGEEFPIEATISQVQADGKKLYTAILRDITERKRAEDALRLNEERLRLAQRAASMGVFDVELNTGRMMWSPQMFEVFGLDGVQEVPQPSAEDMLRMCHPDDRQLVEEQFVYMATGKAVHVECRIFRPDGEERWVEFLGKTMTDDAGRAMRCVGVGRDITSRKRAEDYRRWSEDRLRALAMRLQTAAERERLRIARELHDQLGQALTGMKMDLAWIVRKHGTGGETWVGMVQDSMKIVDSTIALVRRITTELRPGMLDALGLPAAIEWHTGEFQRRTGIFCAVHVPEDPMGLQDDEKIAIFRIYQEALTNIARHASAKNVVVNLEREQSDAILTISDDGVGFSVDLLEQTQSLGVAGMRERALLLGAQFSLQSSRGSGTTIMLRIPLGDATVAGQETHEDIDR